MSFNCVMIFYITVGRSIRDLGKSFLAGWLLSRDTMWQSFISLGIRQITVTKWAWYSDVWTLSFWKHNSHKLQGERKMNKVFNKIVTSRSMLRKFLHAWYCVKYLLQKKKKPYFFISQMKKTFLFRHYHCPAKQEDRSPTLVKPWRSSICAAWPSTNNFCLPFVDWTQGGFLLLEHIETIQRKGPHRQLKNQCE